MTQPSAPELLSGDGPFRARLRIVMHPPHLRRTVTIAAIVGVILTVINQGDILVAGDATTKTWIKTGLNFVVPFVVSNLGLLAGHRHDENGRDSASR